MQHGLGEVLACTVATLEDVDGEACDERRENLVELLEVLESIEDKSFLRLLARNRLVSVQLLSEHREVAGLEHDLVAESEDAVHFPFRAAGFEHVGLQHDGLQVFHHVFDERGKSVALQSLQEGLVKVLGGVAMPRVHVFVTKRLRDCQIIQSDNVCTSLVMYSSLQCTNTVVCHLVTLFIRLWFFVFFYLGRCCEVKLLPVQVSPLPDDGVIRERIAEEVHEPAGDLTRENVTVLLLSAAEEFQRVGAELQRAAHVGDPAIFHWRFSWLSGAHRTN